MKVWIDLSNAPHVRFFKGLIRELEKEHEVLVTARQFGYLEGMLEKYEIRAKIIGKHGGKDNERKLFESINREQGLAKLVKDEKPDVFVGKHSVEGARVAYGLGIRSIMVADNENGTAMNDLFIPLAGTLVIPVAMESAVRERYGNRDIVTFNGVCEMAHIDDFEPDKSVMDSLGIDGRKMLVVRTGPLEAHYFNDNGSNLAKFLKGLDYQVVAFPRNCVDKEELERIGVVIPEEGIDTLSLTYYADAFLGEGGTMNREAALLGTPAVSCYPEKLLAVDRFLIKKGLMRHSLDTKEIKEAIESADKEKSREKAIEVVSGLESPIPKIKELIGV